jgi:hypothetical protein
LDIQESKDKSKAVERCKGRLPRRQRCGFKSNHKKERKEPDKQLIAVTTGIAKFTKRKENSGFPTLGKYFAGLEAGKDVRRQ